jgi:hypothetical protein
MRSLELVLVLLDAGASVQSTASGFDFPLTCAVEFLDEEGETLTHVDIELVQLLLGAGADVNPGPDESPLIKAATSCHPELVSLLLSAGADPNFSRSDDGSTPLIEVVRSEGPISDVVTIVRHLLQAGADVLATVQYDATVAPQTVLQCALYRSSLILIEVLLEAGARCTEATLTDAVEVDNLEIFKLFLGLKVRVTQKMIEYAARDCGSEMFWLLLESADDMIKESNRSGALSRTHR